jgi:hypothetical protein
VKLRILAGLAQIPLRVDMVYWPTPSAPRDGRHDQRGNFQTALLGRITPASTAPPVSPRGAAAVRRINPGAAAGVGSKAPQSSW